MVLAPGHEGPHLERFSPRQDRFPAGEADISQGDTLAPQSGL